MTMMDNSNDVDMRSIDVSNDVQNDISIDIPTILKSDEEPNFPTVSMNVDKRITEENDDPTKCSVCKEAAGKHSYYG
jgi:hypothetical protein